MSLTPSVPLAFQPDRSNPPPQSSLPVFTLVMGKRKELDIDSAEGQSKNVEAAALVDNVVKPPSQPSILCQLVTQQSNQQPQPVRSATSHITIASTIEEK